MVVDILVVAGAVAVAGFLAWFFFGSRAASETTQEGGVQEATVVVQGGYSPALIQARKGVPLRIHFDRREGSDCTSRVIFPDFNVSKSLPAMATATVELLPDKAGEFDFSCQMGMIHGKLIVTDNGAAAGETPVAPDTAGAIFSREEQQPADERLHSGTILLQAICRVIQYIICGDNRPHALGTGGQDGQ